MSSLCCSETMRQIQSLFHSPSLYCIIFCFSQIATSSSSLQLAELSLYFIEKIKATEREPSYPTITLLTVSVSVYIFFKYPTYSTNNSLSHTYSKPLPKVLSVIPLTNSTKLSPQTTDIFLSYYGFFSFFADF